MTYSATSQTEITGLHNRPMHGNCTANANFYLESWQLESAYGERRQAYIDELLQILRKREAVIGALRKAMTIEQEQLVALHLSGPANDE